MWGDGFVLRFRMYALGVDISGVLSFTSAKGSGWSTSICCSDSDFICRRVLRLVAIVSEIKIMGYFLNGKPLI